MKKGDLLGVSWDDRAQVRFLSTNASSGTTNVAVRHSRHGEHRKVPNVAIIYNGGMRGVDCNDQLVDQYASELKTNKLWRKVVFHLIDRCVTNSYIMYKHHNENPLEHHNFLVQVVEGLVGNYQEPKKRPGRKAIAQSRRLTERHFLEPISGKNRRDCGLCSNRETKGIRVSNECKDCDIGLYDFKPASVDPTQMAAVDIGDNNEVRVTVPHIESSGTNATVFQGSKKPYQKECVLIIDHATGSITLEKLDSNIQLKKTRAEGGNRKYMQRPVTPVEHSKGPGSRFSPSQKFTPSPNEMSRISPNTNSSPAETYSPHQPSPVQSSPSMPVLVPPANSSSSFHLKKPSPPVKVANSMPTFSQLVNDTQNNIEEIGILSDSSDSDMDSVKSNKLWSHPVNRSEAPGAMINLLGKDLELSETESESDG
ncbi:Ell-associated factor Eaf [Nymphon striatum]|nr:Ell-associated factor Eaf [Nymphon striatum]